MNPQLCESHVCAVCQDTYTEPKILPCGHSFCTLCIHNVVPYKCPVCGVIPATKVDVLAVNYALRDLCQELRKPVVHECRQCPFPKEKWCFTCQMPLCAFFAPESRHCGHDVLPLQQGAERRRKEELAKPASAENAEVQQALCLLTEQEEHLAKLRRNTTRYLQAVQAVVCDLQRDVEKYVASSVVAVETSISVRKKELEVAAHHCAAQQQLSRRRLEQWRKDCSNEDHLRILEDGNARRLQIPEFSLPNDQLSGLLADHLCAFTAEVNRLTEESAYTLLATPVPVSTVLPSAKPPLDAISTLYKAITNTDIPTIRTLLERYDVKQFIDGRRTPLGQASLVMNNGKPSIEVIKVLLRAGADPTVGAHYPPVTSAARGGRIEVLRAFLDWRVPVNYADKNGDTLLIDSVIGAASNNVGLLLDRGANINYPDKRGKTPLMYAALGRCMPVLTLLLSRNADCDVQDAVGQTALHIAVVNDSEPAVAALIEKGTVRTLRDKFGETAQEIAVRRGYQEITGLFA